VGSSHHGSFFTIAGIAGILRPSPVFRYSFSTFGWIRGRIQDGSLAERVEHPLAQLEQRLAELPTNREIVAYCRGPWCVLSVSN
jgi:rhodanese-related sulfurtransferase